MNPLIYYHDVVKLGGLSTQSYEFIAGELFNKGYLTTGGLFRGQAIKFRSVGDDADSAIGSPSIVYCILYCLS